MRERYGKDVQGMRQKWIPWRSVHTQAQKRVCVRQNGEAEAEGLAQSASLCWCWFMCLNVVWYFLIISCYSRTAFSVSWISNYFVEYFNNSQYLIAEPLGVQVLLCIQTYYLRSEGTNEDIIILKYYLACLLNWYLRVSIFVLIKNRTYPSHHQLLDR